MKKTFYFLILGLVLFLSSCGHDHEKSMAIMEKGVDYMYRAQYEEAMNCLNEAIKYDENNYEAYYYRGCVKVNTLRRTEGLVDYNKAIEINPEYYPAYFNIGLYYRRIKDYDMACYYFRKADELGRPNMEDYLKVCH